MTLKNWNLGTCHPHVKVNTNARIFKFSRKFYIRMIWLGIGTCPCNNILLEVLDTWKNALEAIIYKDFSTIQSGFLVLTLFKYSYIQKYIFICYYLLFISYLRSLARCQPLNFFSAICYLQMFTNFGTFSTN